MYSVSKRRKEYVSDFGLAISGVCNKGRHNYLRKLALLYYRRQSEWLPGSKVRRLKLRWIYVENGQAIINQKDSSYTLPSTGGRGTTMIYIIGAALVITAGVVLVMRKKMSSDKEA